MPITLLLLKPSFLNRWSLPTSSCIILARASCLTRHPRSAVSSLSTTITYCLLGMTTGFQSLTCFLVTGTRTTRQRRARPTQKRRSSGKVKGECPSVRDIHRPQFIFFSVHQMTILESESTGEGTPQGVVLALVSTEDTSSSRESENLRVLRMYNLGSLISLAKYYATQKVCRLNHAISRIASRPHFVGCSTTGLAIVWEELPEFWKEASPSTSKFHYERLEKSRT